MKAKDPRVVLLTVAEVKDMIVSLSGAKTGQNLNGRQRQQIQDVCDELDHARNHAQDGVVSLPEQLFMQFLGCVTMTQKWLSDMLGDLFGRNTDE